MLADSQSVEVSGSVPQSTSVEMMDTSASLNYTEDSPVKDKFIRYNTTTMRHTLSLIHPLHYDYSIINHLIFLLAMTLTTDHSNTRVVGKEMAGARNTKGHTNSSHNTDPLIFLSLPLYTSSLTQCVCVGSTDFQQSIIQLCVI